jgi:hypothetical protein
MKKKHPLTFLQLSAPPPSWLLICLLIVTPALEVRAQPPDPGRQPIPASSDSLLLAFLSDSQSPIIFERLVLSSNNNEEAREMIYSAILREQPDAVFHLGDMVAMGFYGASWESIDGFVERLRRDTIPFYPVMGNHELMFFPGVGEREFLGRFSYARKTGYMRRSGHLAVILLNSNFPELTEEERREQQGWYERALRDLDGDSTVKVVLVACHHSPFTNSTIVSPAEGVQREFVPPFIRSAKAWLFLSGHAHAAEHFREQGKDFLVIGGGGGLQQPLLTGRDRRWVDHFPISSRVRMFHYARCAVSATSLSFSIQMLADDGRDFREVFRLTTPLPPGRASAAADSGRSPVTREQP